MNQACLPGKTSYWVFLIWYWAIFANILFSTLASTVISDNFLEFFGIVFIRFRFPYYTWFIRVVWSFRSFSRLWYNVCNIGDNVFFDNSSMKAIGPFIWGAGDSSLMYSSVSFMVIDLFMLFFLMRSILVNCIFLRNYPFCLVFKFICIEIYLPESLLWYFKSLLFPQLSPPSHFVFCIFVLCPFPTLIMLASSVFC